MIYNDRVQRHGQQSLNKRDTVWNICLSPNTKSMKGILILFIDPNDSGQLFGRDPEKNYNPKISKVSITLDGNPNQLYSSGMLKHQSWREIRNHFADGRHRTVRTVAKELELSGELSEMTLVDYLTTKYGLWLDMRTTDDSLFGSGRKLEGASHLQIEKDAVAAGDLYAYVFYICDAQLNFERSRLVVSTFG